MNDTSLDFRYLDAVLSWKMRIQGQAEDWGGTSGQLSIGDNAPFAGVTDRYVATLFHEYPTPLVFAKGVRRQCPQVFIPLSSKTMAGLNT